MAGSSISFPCLSSTKKAIKPSVNVVQRLYMRQLRGHLRPTRHSYPVCRSLFGKIPGRLGIPLKQIVDANALHEEGHVFLGFSKDGQFVLSYTLNVHADDHTAYPVYVYKLYWWRFRDNQPMQKVSEVRLFGEEEDIQQDLYLAVCSWPTDASKVMVYGCCTNSSAEHEEEKLLCYVTITGVPSNKPCPKCLHMKYSAEPINGMSGVGSVWTPPELMEELSITDPAPPSCLRHGFAVHTKYELAPPFPSFSPKHSLAKDGVAVLNTGDSIIAIAVNVGEEKLHCGSLYSPLRSSGSTQRFSDSNLLCSQSESPSAGCRTKFTRTCATQTDGIFVKDSPSIPARKVMKKDCTGVVGQHMQDRISQVCCEDELPGTSTQNVRQPYSTTDLHDLPGTSGQDLVSLCDSPAFCSQEEDGTPDQEWPFSQESLVSRPRRGPGHIDQLAMMGCGKAFTASMPEIRISLNGQDGVDKSNDLCADEERSRHQGFQIIDAFDEVQMKPKRPKKRPYSNTNFPDRCLDSEQKWTGCKRQERTLNTRSVGTSPIQCAELIGLYAGVPGHADGRRDVHEHGRIETKKDWFLDSDDSLIGSEIYQQCPYHHTSFDVSSTQDSAFTIQECTCILQGFTYSVRRYVEKMPYLDTDEPIDIDTPDYDSMLPVVVCGTQTHPMVISNRNSLNEGPFIQVKQLTMDAEHYICDTIRTSASWGRRYIAFTDYDMQILEVCPHSSCVVVMIMALIRAWPETKKETKDVFDFNEDSKSSTPRLYQTAFKFTWSLKTGKQKTFEVDDLVEFDQTHLRKTWNPGRSVCQDLQKKCSIPQGLARGVHVLTNEAVFRNKSLNRLLDSEHYVAIVLT
ncbi:DDB1- and CUL4-associated factor 15-like [Amphiura filiformis]|uniref:DDB1- and CUL4-associated factor 15-like n=1 Tax=Amphiura filiformis TaxID=82378 RepID=UPI003B228B37